MYSCTPECRYAIGLIKNVPTYFCPFMPTSFCLSSSLSHSSYVFFFSSPHSSSLFFILCIFLLCILLCICSHSSLRSSSLFFAFFLCPFFHVCPLHILILRIFSSCSTFSIPLCILHILLLCRYNNGLCTNETVFQNLTKTIIILTGIDL